MTEIQKDPPNLSRQDTAKQLGIAATTLDRWVRNSDFPPPIKMGSSRNSPTRWRQSTIDAWVSKQIKGAA